MATNVQELIKEHPELAEQTLQGKLNGSSVIWVELCSGEECPLHEDAEPHLPAYDQQGHPRCSESGRKVASPEVGGPFYYEEDGEITGEECPHPVVVPVTTRLDYVCCTKDVEKRSDNVPGDPHGASDDDAELEPACIAAMHYDQGLYGLPALYEGIQYPDPRED